MDFHVQILTLSVSQDLFQLFVCLLFYFRNDTRSTFNFTVVDVYFITHRPNEQKIRRISTNRWLLGSDSVVDAIFTKQKILFMLLLLFLLFIFNFMHNENVRYLFRVNQTKIVLPFGCLMVSIHFDQKFSKFTDSIVKILCVELLWCWDWESDFRLFFISRERRRNGWRVLYVRLTVLYWTKLLRKFSIVHTMCSSQLVRALR